MARHKFIDGTLEIAGEQGLTAYHIDKELGDGGCSTVFRGRQSPNSAPVALKVFTPHPETRGPFGFTVEAEIGRRCVGKYVATTLNAGESIITDRYSERHVRGTIVTEYIPHPALTYHLERKGRLPVRQVVELAEYLGTGLEEIHAQGVIHRDVKPDNVLYGGRRSNRRVAIVDFSVAHVLGSPSSGLYGTVGYFSPEQRENVIGPAADVFSFGATIFELLQGKQAFPGRNAYESLLRCDQGLPQLELTGRDKPFQETLMGELCRATSIDPKARPNPSEFAASLREAYEKARTVARKERRWFEFRKPAISARVFVAHTVHTPTANLR